MAGDIIAFVKRAVDVGTRSVDKSILLKEATLCIPKQFLGNNDGNISGLMKDVSMAPELPGYEEIVASLLKNTLDFYRGDSYLKLAHSTLGIRPSSGIIIQGPSGTGKTALAHLIGRRASGKFKFLSVSCAELVHKVIGETERRLSIVFKAGTINTYHLTILYL